MNEEERLSIERLENDKNIEKILWNYDEADKNLENIRIFIKNEYLVMEREIYFIHFTILEAKKLL